MVGRGKITLHHYWQDGQTVELRYFHTKKAAKEFAKREGYIDYVIDEDVK